jgi:hypothetical protein
MLESNFSLRNTSQNITTMNKQTILLEPRTYHEYVEGKEIHCASRLPLETGDHVMVYKNSIAASTSISVPHSSQQAEAIGVEGLITGVEHNGPVADLLIKKI